MTIMKNVTKILLTLCIAIILYSCNKEDEDLKIDTHGKNEPGHANIKIINNTNSEQTFQIYGFDENGEEYNLRKHSTDPNDYFILSVYNPKRYHNSKTYVRDFNDERIEIYLEPGRLTWYISHKINNKDTLITMQHKY